MASPSCTILQDNCLLVPSCSLQRRHLSLPHLFVSDYSDYYDSSDSDNDDEVEETSLDSATVTQYAPADSNSSTNGHGEDMIDFHGDDDQDKSSSPYFTNYIRGQVSSQQTFNLSATHKSNGTRMATVLSTSRTTEITIKQPISPLATDTVKSTEKPVKSKPHHLPLLLSPDPDEDFVIINHPIKKACRVSDGSYLTGDKESTLFRPIRDTGKAQSHMDIREFSRTSEIESTLSIYNFFRKNKKLPDLHKATSQKSLLKMLAHPNIDPNVCNGIGDLPLHTYVSKGLSTRMELLVTLLSSGHNIKINALNADGNTALHIAAQKEDMISVRVLFVFGADPQIENTHKMRAIEIVSHEGPLRDFLSRFSSVPGFNSVRNRDRTMSSPCFPCNPGTLGYLLNWRREATLSLQMEKEIERMLNGEELNNVTEAGAAFIQWNLIKNWRQTRSHHTRPGSRVLFLDGGGIRGLVQIEILIELERRTGRKITELFDWIIGTSTGGIVALGLVYAKMSLEQLRALYFKMGQKVFSGSYLYANHKSAALEKILIDIFQDKMMDSIEEPKVMIAAVNISNSSLDVEFFNNFNDDEPKRHLKHIHVWQVARATSAGPMYFTSFNKYVDGGVKANNPCEFAMTEIRQYYHTRGLTPPHFPIMVSIGTGRFPAQKLDELNVSFNIELKDMLTPKHLFDLLLYTINNSEEVAVKFKSQCLHMGTPFFRFNPSFRDEIKPNETDISILIDMIIKTKFYLMSGEALGGLFEMVRVFEQLDDLSATEDNLVFQPSSPLL